MSLDFEYKPGSYSDSSEAPFLRHDEDNAKATDYAASFKTAICVATVVVISIITATILFVTTPTPGQVMSWDCGNTPEEARANNCHYEQMLVAWVPSPCFYADLDAEYDFFGDRLWFFDKYLTQSIDPDLLRAGEVELGYSRHSTHDEHCLYAMRKLTYAVTHRQRYVDSQSYDYEHTSHCTFAIRAALLNDTDAGYNLVSVNGAKRGYLKCVRL